MGVAWPSTDISQECTYATPHVACARDGNASRRTVALISGSPLTAILVSPPLLLTARLAQGSKVNVFPLASAKLPPGVPSLRRAQLALTVHVKEVPVGQSGNSLASETSPAPANVGKGKRRDWLTLLIREALSAFISSLSPRQIFHSVADPQRSELQST